MPFVSIDPSDVHYEVDGSGPGLVLVHGVGGDAEKVFGPVAPHFTDRFTVVRPNLSGSGGTTDDGRELTVDLLAEQVTAAARAAADGPVDLFGFSLGAVVAAATAATHPELVRKLVLVGGWAHTTGPRDRFYFDTWRHIHDIDRETFKRFATITGFSPAAVDAFGHEGLVYSLADEWPPPGISRQIDASSGVDLRPLLPRITAPTLVIGLRQDQMVPVTGSHQLHAGIKGSRLLELDGGHMDWFVDPSQIIKHTNEFLAD